MTKVTWKTRSHHKIMCFWFSDLYTEMQRTVVLLGGSGETGKQVLKELNANPLVSKVILVTLLLLFWVKTTPCFTYSTFRLGFFSNKGWENYWNQMLILLTFNRTSLWIKYIQPVSNFCVMHPIHMISKCDCTFRLGEDFFR